MDENRSEKLVTVYVANGELDAHVIKGLLEVNGIPSLIKANAPPAAYIPLVGGIGDVRIMVEESKAEEARQLIMEDKSV